jgi:beta-glucosidase
MTKKLIYRFPKGFLWGTATSAHQTEGGNLNDWTIWEPGHIADNSISGLACDSYRRFSEDIALAKKLNNNAYRFSIEWSRIEPRPHQFDKKALQHYQAMVDECLRQKLTPLVTIYHFTLPIWFIEAGGWTNSAAPQTFNNYALYLAQNLKRVKLWCTINEPGLYAWNAYGKGKWPPQQKNLLSWWQALNNIIKAHRLAYQSLHLAAKNCQVGIANNSQALQPTNNWLINRWLNSMADYFINNHFFQKTRGYHDYIGINYYFHRLIGIMPKNQANTWKNDLGWEINPQGLYQVLLSAKKYNLPIYILENGLADAKDQHRQQFITEHLIMVHKAIQAGCLVKGYFHWSLLDNFEWKWGFTPRFGLYSVDYQSLERRPRPSSRLYAKICKNNGF